MINIVQLWQLAVPLQRQRVVFEQKSYRCDLKRAAQFPVVMTYTFHKPLKSSKNLKGQLGPPVNHVTFFDQKRSVEAACESTDVFCTKRGQLEPGRFVKCTQVDSRAERRWREVRR